MLPLGCFWIVATMAGCALKLPSPLLTAGPVATSATCRISTGDAFSDCDHRLGEILDRMNPCSAANQELLVRSLHEAARAHGVRFGYRRCDFLERKVMVDESGWVDDHLVLFQVAPR